MKFGLLKGLIISTLILLIIFSVVITKKHKHKNKKFKTRLSDSNLLSAGLCLNQVAQGLTYGENDGKQKIIIENTEGATVRVFKSVKDLKEVVIDDGKVICGISHKDDTTVICSFRGTKNLCNVKKDLEAEGTEITSNPLQGCSDCLVHKGFLDSYKKIRNDVRGIIKDYISGGILRFIITGHSLGGALAEVCGYDMVDFYKEKPYKWFITTFGAPRVGDQKLADFMNGNKGLVRHVRVTFGEDIFPKIPSEVGKITYVHSGTEIHFTEVTKFEIKDINKDLTPKELQSGFLASVLKNAHTIMPDSVMCSGFLTKVSNAIFGFGKSFLDKSSKNRLKRRNHKRLSRKEVEQLGELVTDHLQYDKVSDMVMNKALSDFETKLG